MAFEAEVKREYKEFDLVFQIQYSQLEKEIQSSTEEKELFYNRGGIRASLVPVWKSLAPQG